jgi:hypothetical protein
MLRDTNSDREENRRCGPGGTTIRQVDEPKAAFPSVKRSHGETFLGAELRDRQTADRMPANAIAPKPMELEVGASRHEVDS